jgi:hypothetical protein
MKIADSFTSGPSSHWIRLTTGPAGVESAQGRLRFLLDGALEAQLADAEIGDYRHFERSALPWRAPLRLDVRARFSHPAAELAGTSGFGFWNNPFREVEGDLLAPPNALWFFCASSRSDMVAAPGLPGHGFRAEMINSGTAPGWLLGLAACLLDLPVLRSLLYRAAQMRVSAAAVRLDGVHMTTWHDYTLDWGLSEAIFRVDGREVLRTPRPPRVPLGFVAWMDNQVAVARPDGDFRFGLEAVPGRQWLELESVAIEPA